MVQVQIIDLLQISEDVLIRLAKINGEDYLLNKKALLPVVESLFKKMIEDWIYCGSAKIIRKTVGNRCNSFPIGYEELCLLERYTWCEIEDMAAGNIAMEEIFRYIEKTLQENSYSLLLLYKVENIYILKNSGDYRILQWRDEHPGD